MWVSESEGEEDTAGRMDGARERGTDGYIQGVRGILLDGGSWWVSERREGKGRMG